MENPDDPMEVDALPDGELRARMEQQALLRFAKLDELVAYAKDMLAKLRKRAAKDPADALAYARDKDPAHYEEKIKTSVEHARKRQRNVLRDAKKLGDQAALARYSDAAFAAALAERETAALEALRAFVKERAALEAAQAGPGADAPAPAGADDGTEVVERKEGESDAAYAKRRAQVIAKRIRDRAYRARKRDDKGKAGGGDVIAPPAPTASAHDAFVAALVERIAGVMRRAASEDTAEGAATGVDNELRLLRLELEGVRALVYAPADLVQEAMRAGAGGLHTGILDAHPAIAPDALPWLDVARRLAGPGGSPHVRMCVSRLSDRVIRLVNNGADDVDAKLNDGLRALCGPYGNAITVRAMQEKRTALASAAQEPLADMSDASLAESAPSSPARPSDAKGEEEDEEEEEEEEEESTATTEPAEASDDEGPFASPSASTAAPKGRLQRKDAGVRPVDVDIYDSGDEEPAPPKKAPVEIDDSDDDEDIYGSGDEGAAGTRDDPMIVSSVLARLAHAAAFSMYPKDTFSDASVKAEAKVKAYVLAAVRHFHALSALVECVGHTINARIWARERGGMDLDRASAQLDEALFEALFDGADLATLDLARVAERAWGAPAARGPMQSPDVYVAPAVAWHWRGMPQAEVRAVLERIRTGAADPAAKERAARDEAAIAGTAPDAAVPLRHVIISGAHLSCPPVWFDVAYADAAIAEAGGLSTLELRALGRSASWGFVWPPGTAVLFRRDRKTALHVQDAMWTLIPAPWQDVYIDERSKQPRLVLRGLREIHLDAVRALAPHTSATLAVYRLEELHIERALAHRDTAPLAAWQTLALDFLRPLDKEENADIDAKVKAGKLAPEKAAESRPPAELRVRVHGDGAGDPYAGEIAVSLGANLEGVRGGVADSERGAYARISVERAGGTEQKPGADKGPKVPRPRAAKRSACERLLHSLSDAIASAGDIVTGVITDVPSLGTKESLLELVEAAQTTRSEAKRVQYVATLSAFDAFYANEFVDRLARFVRDHRVWLPVSAQALPSAAELNEILDDTAAQLVELGAAGATRAAVQDQLRGLTLAGLHIPNLAPAAASALAAVKHYRLVDAVRRALTADETFAIPADASKDCLLVTHGLVPVTRMDAGLMPMTRTYDGDANAIVCVMEAHAHTWAAKLAALPEGAIAPDAVDALFGDFAGLWLFLPALVYHTEPSELGERAAHHSNAETEEGGDAAEDDTTRALGKRTRGERFCVLQPLTRAYLERAGASLAVTRDGSDVTLHYRDRLLPQGVALAHATLPVPDLVSVAIPMESALLLLGASIVRASAALHAMVSTRRASVPSEAHDAALENRAEAGAHPVPLRLEDDASLYTWAAALAKCARLAHIAGDFLFVPALANPGARDFRAKRSPFEEAAEKAREDADLDAAQREDALRVPEPVDEDISITDLALLQHVALLTKDGTGKTYAQAQRLLADPRASVADLLAPDALQRATLITEEEAQDIDEDGERTVRYNGGMLARERRIIDAVSEDEKTKKPIVIQEEVEMEFPLQLHAISTRNDVTLFLAAQLAVSALARNGKDANVARVSGVLTARAQRLFPYVLPPDAYGLAGDIDLEFYARFWPTAAQSAFAAPLAREQLVESVLSAKDEAELAEQERLHKEYIASGAKDKDKVKDEDKDEDEDEDDVMESSDDESAPHDDAPAPAGKDMRDAKSVLERARPLLEAVENALLGGRTDDVPLAHSLVDACAFARSDAFVAAAVAAGPMDVSAPPASAQPIVRTVLALRRWALDAMGTIDYARDRVGAMTWAIIFSVSMYSYARKLDADAAVLDAVARAGGRSAWQRGRNGDAIGDNLDTLYEALMNREATDASVRAAAADIAKTLVTRLAQNARRTPGV